MFLRRGSLAVIITVVYECLFILHFSSKIVFLGFWRLAVLFGAKAPFPGEQWGSLTSLYNSLTSRQVFFLERSIQYHYAAQFDVARVMFQHLLPPSSSLPILALERATLYEMEGFDGLAATCLQEAMTALPGLGLEISLPVSRLIQIRFATAELSAHGKLRQALAAARELRPWLELQLLENYTDVTTQCYSHYQAIMKIAKLHSNWLDCSIDGNVPRAPQESYAISATVVRRSLQAQRMFNQCQQLVKQESGLYEDDDERALEPFQEFLECDWVQSKSPVVVYKTTFLRVFYAQKLMELRRRDQAAEQLQHAEISLRQVGGKDISKYNPRLHLLLELTWTRINAGDDPVAQIEHHLRLSESAAMLGDRPIRRPELIFAFRKADKLVDRTPPNVSFGQAHELRDRTVLALVEFQSEQTSSAFFLAPSLSSLGLFAADNGFAAEWVEMFEHFRAIYPDHEIPAHSYLLTKAALSAYRNLQDESAIADIKIMHRKHLSSCPHIICRPDGTLEPYLDGPDDEYFREWAPEFWPEQEDWPILVRYQLVSATILLRWVRKEVTNNLLDAALGGQILKWKPSEGLVFELWLEQASAASLQITIYGSAASPTKAEEWDAWFAIVCPWLRRSDLPPSVMHRHNLLKEICNCRVQTLIYHPPTSPQPIDWLQRKLYEARICLDTISALESGVVRDAELRTCRLHVASSIIILAANQIARQTGIVDDKDLAQMQELLEQVAHEYREMGEKTWLLHALMHLRHLSWIRYFHLKSLSNTVALKYIEEADEIVRYMFSQYENLPGEQSFAASLAAADHLSISDLYNSGTRVSFSAFQQWLVEHQAEINANLEAPLPAEAQELVQHFVDWTQKAKARTTTRIFGSSFTVPLGSTMDSAAARLLLEREQKLLDEWSGEVTMMERLKMRVEWRHLRQEMREDNTLKGLIEAKTGASLTSEELRQMCTWFGEDVILVDFVQISLWDGWDLALLIFRNGELLACQPLPIKHKEIENWVASNLELDRRIYDLDDDSSFFPLKDDCSTRELKKISGLLKPLEQYTRPGDLLVFCPVQALNRVPLHALSIGVDVCIHRNPVVYCQSFNLLRLCFINRFQNGGLNDLRSVVYNPLQNEISTAAAVAQLAKTLGTQVEEQDTSKTRKEDFLSKISMANLIHFHGHIRFDDADPLRHHLELAPTHADDKGDVIPLRQDEILTAKNVLSARIRPGAHVTTISCKSARTRVTKANDLVGLGTAFHCAGAGSMVSTLWNIWRDDGIRLSQEFYRHLLEQGGKLDAEGELPVLVDMARAMQHAILKLRTDANGEVRAPYHWAGFVLNGAWQLQNLMPKAFA